MKILLLDNYDSFTYNLKHYLESFDVEVTVIYNDEVILDEIEAFDKIVFSPGPGLPKNAGQLLNVIDQYHRIKPILGVCLGFQAIAEYFGGKLYNQTMVKHGVNEKITSKPSLFYENIPSEIKVGLYHSWALQRFSIPAELKEIAISENDVCMAFEHVSFPIIGVQYHPESILTEYGKQMIANFINNY